MKKYLAILTLLSLWFTLGVNSSVLAGLPETNAYPTTIWNYDFTTDDETTYLATFEKKYAATPIIVDDPVPTEERGKVAVYPRNEIGTGNPKTYDNYAGPYYNLVTEPYKANQLDQLKYTKLTADILLTDKFAVTLRIIDYPGTGAKNMNIVTFNADGTMKFLNGPTLDYSANQWYSFVFYLDISGAVPVYSAYLNGELACRYESLTTGFQAVKTLRFTMPSATGRAGLEDAVYIDNWGYFTAEESIEIPEFVEPDPELPVMPEKPIEPLLPVTQIEGDGYNYTVWEADFENNEPGDSFDNSIFKSFPSDAIVTAHSEVMEAGGENGNILKMSMSMNENIAVRSSYDHMTHDFPAETADQLSQAKFTVDVKLNRYMRSYIETLTYTTNGFISFIEFTKEGTIILKTYNQEKKAETVTVGEYDLDTWYRLVCYIDADTGTFNLYINNELVAKNLRYSREPQVNGFRAIGVCLVQGESEEEEFLEESYIQIDNLSINGVDRWLHNEKTVFHDNFDGNYTQIYGLDSYPSIYYRMYDKSASITDVPQYGEDGELISSTDPERGKTMRLDTMHKDRTTQADGYFDTQYNVIRTYYPDKEGERLTKLKTSFDIMLEAGSFVRVSFHNYPQSFYSTITFNTSGTITFGGSTVRYNPAASAKYATYEANKWYNVTIYIDISNGIGTYTALINGEKVASAKLHNSAVFTGIDNVRFNGSQGDESKYAYIDNLKIDAPGSPLVKVTKEYQDEATVGGKIIYKLNPNMSDPATILVSGRKDNKMTDISFKNMDFSSILSNSGTFPYELSAGKEMKIFYWKDWSLQPMAQPTTITYEE